MQRPTLAFQATIRSHVLTEDGQLASVDDESTRPLTFVLHRSPLVRERHRIDLRLHSLAGGLDAWLDLQEGIEGARGRIRREGVDPVALATPPDTPEAREALEEALAGAWNRANPRLRAGLIEMIALARRLEWMARWEVLFVRAECDGVVVDGWTDVAELPLTEDATQALWTSYDRALEGAEGDAGKPSPSAS